MVCEKPIVKRKTAQQEGTYTSGALVNMGSSDRLKVKIETSTAARGSTLASMTFGSAARFRTSRLDYRGKPMRGESIGDCPHVCRAIEYGLGSTVVARSMRKVPIA